MKKKRTLGVLAATFAAAALPLVAASPASADAADCLQYLSNVGYQVGPRTNAACDRGAGGIANVFCEPSMISIGVKWEHASEACYQASL
ncbi:hypothetical protein [Streptomyces bambusae]|uniref:Uncharacterized protein n=1 Tax=Streptomyces bambusae TaxID=1550616 RepID=A0ABS6YYX2_9ACTN|nr:hypothetical protein [Streptomyces bambusae]MBW5480679.1 hypothetical protein [Streptomyces bambusae]